MLFLPFFFLFLPFSPLPFSPIFPCMIIFGGPRVKILPPTPPPLGMRLVPVENSRNLRKFRSSREKLEILAKILTKYLLMYRERYLCLFLVPFLQFFLFFLFYKFSLTVCFPKFLSIRTFRGVDHNWGVGVRRRINTRMDPINCSHFNLPNEFSSEPKYVEFIFEKDFKLLCTLYQLIFREICFYNYFKTVYERN